MRAAQLVSGAPPLEGGLRQLLLVGEVEEICAGEVLQDRLGRGVDPVPETNGHVEGARLRQPPRAEARDLDAERHDPLAEPD